jgi:hypothetical protein
MHPCPPYPIKCELATKCKYVDPSNCPYLKQKGRCCFTEEISKLEPMSQEDWERFWEWLGEHENNTYGMKVFPWIYWRRCRWMVDIRHNPQADPTGTARYALKQMRVNQDERA